MTLHVQKGQERKEFMMSETKSVAELFGGKAEAKAEKESRRAASDLWAWDFKGAPEWFVRKYFTDDNGHLCGRMHVKNYAKLGCNVRKDGVLLTNAYGRPKKLTTGLLAQLVEEDIKKAGFSMKIHFKGYSLDPKRFVMTNPWLQEEYEENERRHVPGLDEDESAERQNGQAPLDYEAWLFVADAMMQAFRTRTLMYWGLDEDFGRVMQASAFVHSAFNAELNALKARIADLKTPEAIAFSWKWDDFAAFDENDAIRTYTRAMRVLTGNEYGESMLENAWLLDSDMDIAYVRVCMNNVLAGTLTPENASCLEEMAALVLLNQDPSDVVPDWKTDPKADDLYDDDTGELATELLLSY